MKAMSILSSMDSILRLKNGIDDKFILFSCMAREEVSEYKGLNPVDRLKLLKALCELRVDVISSCHLLV